MQSKGFDSWNKQLSVVAFCLIGFTHLEISYLRWLRYLNRLAVVNNRIETYRNLLNM